MSILAHQSLVQMIRGVSPVIIGKEPIEDKRIQIASVDLALSDHVYGMRTSVLPEEGMPMERVLEEFANYHFDLTEDEDKLLLKGHTFVVPLNEALSLPKGFSARFSPKSSIGRVDVFVRVLADGVPNFDRLDGYEGRLYLEITPLSFGINIRKGQSLVQMRIREGAERFLSSTELALRQASTGIVWGKDGNPLAPNVLRLSGAGIFMHADLDRDIVGFKSRQCVMNELSFARQGEYDPEEFWEPIPRPAKGYVIIEPGVFYLLATRERIKIPEDACAEMAPYDVSAGEIRTHYAGFFDPGFGGTGPGTTGTVGVMEIRGRELPFCLRDGQPVCRMDFEPLDRVPDILYGQSSKESHYTSSGASLSKFFRRREAVWED